MRPDVTMQIARMCASRSESTGGLTKPLRLRYTQRVFREKTVEASARELTQCGAECLGISGSSADVELISMFARALEECGLTRFTIALGSAGVLRDLLSVSDASKQWQDAVLQAYHTSNFVYLGELVAAAQRGQADKHKIEHRSSIKQRMLRTVKQRISNWPILLLIIRAMPSLRWRRLFLHSLVCAEASRHLKK